MQNDGKFIGYTVTGTAGSLVYIYNSIPVTEFDFNQLSQYGKQQFYCNGLY